MKRFLQAMVAVLLVSHVAMADDKPHIKFQSFAKNLDHPTFLTSDGTERIFVVEQPGVVQLFIDGKKQAKPYLDISDRVLFGGEQGLLCIRFHPDFAKNGLMYVDYVSSKPNKHTVIAEYHADPKAETVDPSTERILLKIDQPFPNHKGGQLAFGPDGMLYIAMGDGGSGGDPGNRAQSLDIPLGKILRIDVSPREGYAIPKDNPFVNTPGARGEVWSYGMRNPWRFSFDRQTGLLWCGDVGQDLFEEVDIIQKGGNYGWHVREGLHQYKDFTGPGPYIDPIKEYSHKDKNGGLCIIGGYVYRGKTIPSLYGWYLYGDYNSGRFWGLKYEDNKVTGDVEIAHTRYQPSSFGEDSAGELYMCEYNSGVYKIVADDSSN